MGKYIIELKRGETAYKTVDSKGTLLIQLLNPISYTEPDTEQVRKEAYQKGLSDAENRKASCEFCEFQLNDESNEPCISCRCNYLNKFRPKQEEQIQVGDEVENTQTGIKFIVTHLWENNRGEQGVSGFNQECSAFSTTLSLVVKTGRHFPEIAEVLRKMREE